MDSADLATVRLSSSATDIQAAATILARGGLVGLPTETVYGLGADAESEVAINAIFEAKGRPSSQPLIVHILKSWASRYGSDWSTIAADLADSFWPGPLTIVVPKTELVPEAVTGGLQTVGLRCPNHPVALSLLSRFGRGIAAPSANLYGHVSPTTADHVLDDLGGRIDAVIDAGPCQVGVESTIVEIGSGESLTLLRRGGVTAEQLSAASGCDVIDGTDGEVRAPGMVLSHYAPLAPVSILEPDQPLGPLDPSVLVISCRAVPHARSVVFDGDQAFAGGLYRALRLGDDPDVTRVLVVPPTEGALVPAIMDRLRRAAHRE